MTPEGVIRRRVSAVVVVLGPAPGIDVVDVAGIDRRPVNVGTVGSIGPVADSRSIIDSGTITNATDPARNAADPTRNATDPANAAGATGPIRPISDSRSIGRELRRSIARTGSVAGAAADARPITGSGTIGRQLRWTISASNPGSVAARPRSDATGRRPRASPRTGTIGRQLRGAVNARRIRRGRAVTDAGARPCCWDVRPRDITRTGAWSRGRSTGRSAGSRRCGTTGSWSAHGRRGRARCGSRRRARSAPAPPASAAAPATALPQGERFGQDHQQHAQDRQASDSSHGWTPLLLGGLADKLHFGVGERLPVHLAIGAAPDEGIRIDELVHIR